MAPHLPSVRRMRCSSSGSWPTRPSPTTSSTASSARSTPGSSSSSARRYASVSPRACGDCDRRESDSASACSAGFQSLVERLLLRVELPLGVLRGLALEGLVDLFRLIVERLALLLLLHAFGDRRGGRGRGRRR